jgi:hypothetical protein
MSELNNEIHELTIAELDGVNGAMLGFFGPGPMAMLDQVMNMVQQMQQGAGSPPPKGDPGAQQFQQALNAALNGAG